MKLYTDFTGKFQMHIPIDWEYKNPSLYRKTEEGTSQAFGFYDKALGAFQISCKVVTDHIKNLIETRNEPIQSSSAEKLYFSEQFIASDTRNVYAFSCAVDDHYFFATYIFKPNKTKAKKIEAELSQVRKVLSSIKFIKAQYRDIVIAHRRLDLFMSSIATVMQLKGKAIETGSFVEYIVYSANHIDALLRLALILNNQLSNKNEDIDVTLLFQNEGHKPVMEKDVYKKCLSLNILNDDLYNRLVTLYNERNKVIHRYIITDIRTEDIFKIALSYERLYEEVDKLMLDIESKQVAEKIGSWSKEGHSTQTEQGKEILYSKIRDKHGKIPREK